LNNQHKQIFTILEKVLVLTESSEQQISLETLKV